MIHHRSVDPLHFFLKRERMHGSGRSTVFLLFRHMEATRMATTIAAQDRAQTEASPESKAKRVAEALFRQNPDWVTFYREIIGVDGVLRKLFPSVRALRAFELTAEYADIEEILAQLRGKSRTDDTGNEPTRVITVRLPKSLHEALKAEGHDRQTSMNQLCITKLLQVVSPALAIMPMSMEAAANMPLPHSVARHAG